MVDGARNIARQSQQDALPGAWPSGTALMAAWTMFSHQPNANASAISRTDACNVAAARANATG